MTTSEPGWTAGNAGRADDVDIEVGLAGSMPAISAGDVV